MTNPKSNEYYVFKKKVQVLKHARGQGTELISIYLPPDAQVNDMSNKLRDEYGQAANIKSKQTRKNVQAAIERLMGMLKGVHKPPEHGVAIFCGNINNKIELFTVLPLDDIQMQTYRCDSSFLTEPLEGMMEAKEMYGLFVMDRREATVALLKGKKIEILAHLTSGVPGKHKSGGQSALRFERITNLMVHEFFKRIAERINESMKDKKVRAILAGGPGGTKNELLNGDYLQNDVRVKVAGALDTSYTDEFGIKELMDRSDEIIKELDANKEKELVQKFLKEAVTNGLATYGTKQVEEALAAGKVSVLMLSEALDEAYVEKISEQAEATDARIEMISTDTPEGEQFHMGFGGIGALLRYR
ncbi:MAG: peptide chain release factor aRF-1 [Candidatus Micrarchaeota archaeon]